MHQKCVKYRYFDLLVVLIAVSVMLFSIKYMSRFTLQRSCEDELVKVYCQNQDLFCSAMLDVLSKYVFEVRAQMYKIDYIFILGGHCYENVTKKRNLFLSLHVNCYGYIFNNKKLCS